jgi:CelD/BcsL family acetyltransferase involved in cellulose biosynthesis
VTTVTVLRTAAELDDYAQRWNAFLETSHRNEVFLTWEWVSSWVTECTHDGNLRVLAVHDDGELVAIAPFCVERVPYGGVFELRILKPLADDVSDYFDIIGGRERVQAWAPVVWNYVFGEMRNEWDVLDLLEMGEDSPVLDAFQKLATKDRRCRGIQTIKRTRCPYLILPESWSGYLAACGSERRYYLTTSLRRLSALGPLEVRFCESPEELPARMGDLISLNKKSWEDRGGSDTFASPELERFHRRAARSLLDRGVLFLCTVNVGGEHVASFYGFEYNKKVYYYISAVKKVPLKRVNVLDTLLGLCMEEAIRRGCGEFDMLRGAEAYKLRWTDKSRSNVSVRFFNGTGRSAVFRLLRGSRNLIRGPRTV